MFKTLTTLAAVVALALPGMAQAESLAPTPAELAADHAVALAYWHTQPPCGQEQIAEAVLPEIIDAWAEWGRCRIVFSTLMDWKDFPELTCSTYVHEFGHLVLGPDYFAATNPGDPAHSPDPTNIMYGGGEPGNGPYATLQQTVEQGESVGCILPPPESYIPHVSREWTQRLSG